MVAECKSSSKSPRSIVTLVVLVLQIRCHFRQPFLLHQPSLFCNLCSLCLRISFPSRTVYLCQSPLTTASMAVRSVQLLGSTSFLYVESWRSKRPMKSMLTTVTPASSLKAAMRCWTSLPAPMTIFLSSPTSGLAT